MLVKLELRERPDARQNLIQNFELGFRAGLLSRLFVFRRGADAHLLLEWDLRRERALLFLAAYSYLDALVLGGLYGEL